MDWNWFDVRLKWWVYILIDLGELSSFQFSKSLNSIWPKAVEHTERAGGAPRRRERTKVGFTLTPNFSPFEVISADIQRIRRDLFTSLFQTSKLLWIQFQFRQPALVWIQIFWTCSRLGVEVEVGTMVEMFFQVIIFIFKAVFEVLKSRNGALWSTVLFGTLFKLGFDE